ncbi:MAG: hypothetical protein OEU50_00570 [Gammaproteobacteria bacterium]|nr:hypothetical protein [Gammaproteobacteria bacterium]
MKVFAFFFCTLSFATPSYAADVDNGSELHSESCTQCHDSDAYTRKDRKVQDLAGLGTQVRFCKDNLGVTWFDDEVDDVIGFLNQKYYHF